MLLGMTPPKLEPSDLAELSIFPLPNVTLFPGAALPLHVFEPRYRELTAAALGARGIMAVARLKPGFEPNYDGRPAVFDVCGVGFLEHYTQRSDGRFDIMLRGLARVRIVEELPPLRAYRQVRAEQLQDTAAPPALVAAWQVKLASLWERLASHLPEQVRDLRALTRGADDASAYADRLAAAMVADPDACQQLLAEVDPAERLRLLAARVQELVDALALPAARYGPGLN